MKKNNKTVCITLRISKEMYDLIEAITEAKNARNTYKIKKTDTIRVLIDRGLKTKAPELELLSN